MVTCSRWYEGYAAAVYAMPVLFCLAFALSTCGETYAKPMAYARSKVTISPTSYSWGYAQNVVSTWR